jgi:tetratricopeptide (TPR) repeat protein
MHRSLFILLALVASATLANNDIEQLLQQGYEQTEAGKLDEAVQIIKQAIDKAPNSSLAYTRLGGVRVLRQEYSEGIKDFQQAIILDQNNASAFVGMAVAYLHMGQHNLAKAALDEAARIDPAKKPEIDKVLSWIDQRDNTETVSH